MSGHGSGDRRPDTPRSTERVVAEEEKECYGLVFNEVQLLLAEKRTSLAAMRTGIAVFALPLSVLSFLIVTSKYYDFFHVMPFLIPLLVISGVLALLGGYLVIRAMIRIHRYDRIIGRLKRRCANLDEFIE